MAKKRIVKKKLIAHQSEKKPTHKKLITKKEKEFSLLFKVLLFIAAFMLYAQTIDYNYALDDVMVTTENKVVHKGISGIPDLITKGSSVGFNGKNTGTYRPVSLFSEDSFVTWHGVYVAGSARKRDSN